MGIEKFVNSLAKNKNIKIKNGINTNIDKKIECNYFYIDFNSIIYTVVNALEKKLNCLLYAIILGNDELQKSDIIKISNEICLNLENITVETYIDFLKTNTIDKFALIHIEEYILEMLNKQLNNKTIEMIYISIDGIPQMSKIIEQKKRRYMGYVISNIKKIIGNENYNNLSENRKIYEENKISFDRSKIISWNDFMDSVSTMLESSIFFDKVKNKCEKIKKINISSQNEYGEGETKIIEHINNMLNNDTLNDDNNNYVIYSPDADFVILGLILYTKLEINKKNINLTLLRHNQQTLDFDSININVLTSNIYEYVLKNINIKKEINMNNICLDLSFLFSLFGNDFIPKMESIDPRNDVDTIIITYAKIIEKENNYLIYCENNFYKLNYIILKKVILELSNNENSLLKNVYIANNFKNYKQLKELFSTEKVCEYLDEYIMITNMVIHEIKKCINNNTTFDMSIYIEKYKLTNEYLQYLLIIEYKENKNKIKKNSIENNIILINKYVKELNNVNKIKLNLKMIPYDTSIDSEYHLSNIKKDFPNEMIEITEYDKKIYMLDRKMGEWEGILNASDYNLGTVKLIKNNKTKKYYLKKYFVDENTEEYYDEFFGIKKMNKEEINKIIEEYLKGLLWIFNFYYNSNIHKKSNNISIWFYKYHKSPLLKQIAEYLTETNHIIHQFKKFNDEITKNNIIKQSNYFDKLEHYLYVTPINNQQNDTIQNKFKKNKIKQKYVNYFPDLQKIIEIILSKGGTKDIIDCRRITFLNKCNLTCVKTLNYQKYIGFIRPIGK